ncbi:DUF485 domain-containing protein [Peribacillus simplex]|uniref:DUF485 domain-containing protein n=1 Tax=Peribacillus simplex TaxID=1478 RepID=UPI0007774A98|nr:DUF485 domain-containing protein [Peribacillus simplex]
MESPVKTGHSPAGHDSGNKYRQLIETEEFKELIQKKNAFIVPVTLFFLAFYFVLPILAAYSDVTERRSLLPYYLGLGICTSPICRSMDRRIRLY